MFYVSFDPGKTTGFALFDECGEVLDLGQLSLDELIDRCAEWATTLQGDDVIIYESFALFQHKAVQQSGSTMEASQAIGIIKALARKTNATLVAQAPSIKPIAQKFSGVKPKGAHKYSHHVDAFNHGVYYLVKNKVRKTALERENENAG